MSLRAVLPRASLRAVVACSSVAPSMGLGALRLLRQPQAIPAARSFSSSVARRQGSFRPQTRPPPEPQRMVFVGNLPWSTSPEDLGMTFRKFGEIVDVRIPTNELGQTRGFAHVQFASIEGAQAAVDAAAGQPIFFGGRHARVEFAANDPNPPQDPSEPTNNLLLYQFHGDEASVQELFAPYIHFINRIHVVRDRMSNMPKGLVFLEFFETEYAVKALGELNQTQTPDGRVVKLRYATPRAPGRLGYQTRDQTPDY
ncbi:RNA-binding domain-containing protein [Auricularia subglabra TFB-10046 SS5]|nr:RNA-binding domain-containing protein [Auricularia subglabra TFB-10046 SS5]